jgi:hypothetical protein
MVEGYGLHRNVHPKHMDETTVTMQAFSPTAEEQYELSVDCEKIWWGDESYKFRTLVLGRDSMGVWTISRLEVDRLKFSVKVDVIDGNPAHSVIVFPANDKARRRDAARRLAVFANTGAFSLMRQSAV